MKRLCNQPHMNYVLPEGNYHVAADYEKYFCITRINEIDDSAAKVNTMNLTVTLIFRECKRNDSTF